MIFLLPLCGLLYWAGDYYRQRAAAYNYLSWKLVQAHNTVQDLTADVELLTDDGWAEPQHPTAVWCNGVPIPWGTEEGAALWEEVVSRALRTGLYNSKNLEDGGWLDMHRDQYRVQGFSAKRAEELVEEQLALGNIPALFYAPQPR